MHLCLFVAIFLLVLVTLIAFEVAMTVSVAEVALKKQSDVEKVVAEGDSVSLCNIDQMYINMIEISEAVRKGDSGHSIKIVLVPTDSLTFEVAYGLDYSNGSAIVKDLPIINEIYVYLNKGSQMLFTVWIGNGNKAKSASLYIFNDVDKLNDYISYQLPSTIYQLIRKNYVIMFKLVLRFSTRKNLTFCWFSLMKSSTTSYALTVYSNSNRWVRLVGDHKHTSY